jgi:hypothetical protein
MRRRLAGPLTGDVDPAQGARLSAATVHRPASAQTDLPRRRREQCLVLALEPERMEEVVGQCPTMGVGTGAPAAEGPRSSAPTPYSLALQQLLLQRICRSAVAVLSDAHREKRTECTCIRMPTTAAIGRFVGRWTADPWPT